MTETTQAPAPAPEHETTRAGLAVQGVLAALAALIFAGVYAGAFITGDAALKHDLLEVLKAVVYAVFFFYFGSSVGSRTKDARRTPHG